METAVLDMPKGVCASSEIGTLGAFFQPSPASETTLVRSDERLIGELVSVLDRQLLSAVDARSEPEFVAVRKNVLPRYVRALRALHDTATNLVSDDVVDQLSDSVMAALATDLQKQELRFGKRLIEQAEFTLWTIRKMRTLSREICKAGDASTDKRQTDISLANEYCSASWWAQFHLDMLFAAMKYDRPIREKIREAVCDGLRAAVDAYAIMKDALLLRLPAAEQASPGALPWDSEDEQLLASSMRDVHADFSDGH